MLEARRRTLAIVEELSDEQLRVPYMEIINPPLWELGHVAWFQEKWMLRCGGAAPLYPEADSLYDSDNVPHKTRWDLPLPSRARTLQYLEDVLSKTLEVTDRPLDSAGSGAGSGSPSLGVGTGGWSW